MKIAEAGIEPVFDLVIQGGTVLDGTGAPGVLADVAITGDKIAAVGDLSQAKAARRFNASGLRVTPGFIDIHTHSDISVTYDPGQASAIAMGVTTQIVGNCGLAMGLTTNTEAFHFEKRWLAPHGARIRWRSFAEFLRQVETRGVATHIAALAGHGTLRKRVMGMANRAPDSTEMKEMQRILAGAMEAGAYGLSSGLEYPPSSFADEDELAELCRVVGGYGGLYATHLRNEGDTLIEAVQEALNISERSGAPLQLSHHKAEGQANWGKVQTTLKMVEEARERGQDVQLDQYPYTAFMTSLAIQVLPRRALNRSMEEATDRLTDPRQRAAIAEEIRSARPDWNDLSETSPWHNIRIGVCRSRPSLQGRSLASLAMEAVRNPIDYTLELLATTKGYLSAVNFAIGEQDIAQVMQYDWTAIGSDGVGTHPGGMAGEDRIHPRSYGTFPRVLGRYVRDLGVLTEAQAIHKMTGLPAARMGWTDRGRIAPGCFADITVYHAETIGDCATFEEPHQFATGIEAVLVNGRLSYENGQPNDTRAGRVLRKH